MVTAAGDSGPQDERPPVTRKRPSRRGWIAVGCGVLTVFLVLVILIRHEPGFYRQARVAGAGRDRHEEADAAESLSRRAVTKASAWHAALDREGPWELVLSAAEANAWLAVDLPRNHARLLPRGVSDPRIALGQRRFQGGARVGLGPLTAVAWVDLEIVLKDVNRLVIAVDEVRLGAIPLPRAAVLGNLARRLAALGAVTELRRLDGRPVLMVYIPSSQGGRFPGCRLEALAVDAGEILLSGETRGAGEPRPPPDPS